MIAEEDACYVRWEPPDIVFVALVGDLSVDEARRRIPEIRSLLVSKPSVFLLVDFRRGGTISPDARAISIGVTKDTNLRGAAIFGASLRLRVLTTFIYQASKIVNPYAKRSPVFFCEAEAEARAWIAERRAAIPT